MPDSNQSFVTHPTQQTVQYTYLPPTIAEEEIDFLELWHVLVREKWLFFFLTLIGTTVAIYMALMTKPVYRAEVLLKPVMEGSSNGPSVPYSGLATAIGIDIGGGNSSAYTDVAILESRTFIGSFLKDEKLLPVLFAENWDSTSQNWKVKEPKQIPTMWEGVEYFKSILKISNDTKTGLVILAIEWHDREKAAQWANLLVEKINGHLRELAIQESRKSMEYLQIELSKTNIVELQQAIVNLLESQIKKIMINKVQTDFAFKIIDSAIAPPEDRFVKPQREVMVILGFALGVFLGIFAAFFRNSLRNQKKVT